MANPRRGRLSNEVIESVRVATDIVELVGQYVNLKRAGGSFKGLCPFHTEKTPSFFVRPDRQMYYCFGCQRGGDPFRFVMEHDGVSFTEAVRLLGQRAGIVVEVSRSAGVSYRASITCWKLQCMVAPWYSDHGTGTHKNRCSLSSAAVHSL